MAIRLMLILLSSFRLWADQSSCPNLDLTQKGRSMENAKVMHQGENNFCYAYAAVQMEAALRKVMEPTAPAHVLSPEHLILKIKDLTGSQDFQGGGFEEMVLSLLLDGGEKIPQAKKSWDKRDVCTDASFRKTFADISKTGLLTNQSTFWSGLSFISWLKDYLSKSCGGVLPLELEKQIKGLEPIALVDAIMAHECSEKINLAPRPEVKSVVLSGDEITQKNLSNLLVKNGNQHGPGTELPVAVAFCANAWDLPTEYYKTLLDKGKKDGHGDLCVPHMVLLAGQRWHDGRCQFLLRNSFGQDCRRKQSAFQYLDLECLENGDLWADGEALANVAFEARALVLPKLKNKVPPPPPPFAEATKKKFVFTSTSTMVDFFLNNKKALSLRDLSTGCGLLVDRQVKEADWNALPYDDSPSLKRALAHCPRLVKDNASFVARVMADLKKVPATVMPSEELFLKMKAYFCSSLEAYGYNLTAFAEARQWLKGLTPDRQKEFNAIELSRCLKK